MINPDQVALNVVTVAGAVAFTAWALYGVLWLICKALDGIVFIVGTILPPFPKAFRRAFFSCVQERRKSREESQ